MTDSQLSIKCNKLQRGEILIVQVGAVSKAIFEMFYQYSTIAPVVEGRNSMNLMHLLGRPYLPSADEEGYQFRRVPKIAERARLAMQMLFFPNQSTADLGSFIVEAKKPESKLNSFFSSLRIEAQDLSSDKLFQGLKEANAELAIMKGHKAPGLLQSIISNYSTSYYNMLEACAQILK